MVASSEGRLTTTPELVDGPASNRLRSHALSQVGSEVAYALVSMFQPSRRSAVGLQGAAEVSLWFDFHSCAGAIGAIVVLHLQSEVGGLRSGRLGDPVASTVGIPSANFTISQIIWEVPVHGGHHAAGQILYP